MTVKLLASSSASGAFVLAAVHRPAATHQDDRGSGSGTVDRDLGAVLRHNPIHEKPSSSAERTHLATSQVSVLTALNSFIGCNPFELPGWPHSREASVPVAVLQVAAHGWRRGALPATVPDRILTMRRGEVFRADGESFEGFTRDRGAALKCRDALYWYMHDDQHLCG